MKKILYIPFLMLVFLIGIVSCQKDNLGKVQGDESGKFRITAEIADNSTKVTYSIDNDNNTITPTWTAKDVEKSVEGDKIIGFDDLGQKFTFTVTGFDDDNKATLDVGDYVPGEAEKLYAIYYPGKTEGNITITGTEGTLAVDLTSQSGSLNDDTPVLMCATADIVKGDGDEFSAQLIFHNQTAIVGIKKFKLIDVAEAKTINSVKVTGLVLTGKFEVVDDVLTLNCDTGLSELSIDGVEIAAGTNGKTTADNALMFAALPEKGASISFIATLDDENKNKYNTTYLTGDIEAGKYYYADKKLTKMPTVAKVGEAEYTTLDDAFKAVEEATSAVTIQMVKDCNLQGVTTCTNNNDVDGVPCVTLDLNSHTITAATNQRVQVGIYDENDASKNKSGKLIIKDSDTYKKGTIQVADNVSGTSPVCATYNSTLIINGGNFISTPEGSTDVDAAVYAKLGAKLIVNGGTFISNSFGSSTESNNEGAIGASSVDGSSDVTEVTINGGVINSSSSNAEIKAMRILRSKLTIGNNDNTDGSPTIYGSINLVGGSSQVTASFNEGNFTCKSINDPLLMIEGNVSATFKDNDEMVFKAEGDDPVSTKKSDLLQITKKEVSGKSYYATATINGGLFITNKISGFYTNYASCKTTMTGGNFYSTNTEKQFFYAYSSTSLAAFSVSGGYYNVAFDNSRLVDGYACDFTTTATFDGKSYGYHVVSIGDDKVAIVNGNLYTSIKDAIYNAKKGSEKATQNIQLVRDCEYGTSDANVSICYANRITLNLAGKKLTVTSKKFTVTDDGNLKIISKNSCDETETGGQIYQNTSNNVVMSVSGGNLEMESGCLINNKATTALSVTGGKVNVTGGLIKGKATAIKNTSGTLNISGDAVVRSEPSSTASTTYYAVELASGGKGSVSISGGWFRSKSEVVPIKKSSTESDATIIITGGKFSEELGTGTFSGTQSELGNDEKTDPYKNTDYTHKITASQSTD